MILFISFTSQLDRSDFDCGKPALNQWFQKSVGQQERSGSVRTTLAVDEEHARIAGFFSLVTYRIEPRETPESFGSTRYPVPAVLLARLAVDRRYQGKGLGKRILFEALHHLSKIAVVLGFQMVVVDALDEEAACFYLKYGFRRFAEHSLKLFMTTRDLCGTFEAELD